MADQGVRISFLSNPSEGDSVIFSGILNGTPILYNSGATIVSFEFTNNDSEIMADPLHRVKIGPTPLDTANNLKVFLDAGPYLSTTIPIYNRVYFSGTIWNVESIYTANNRIVFDIQVESSSVGLVSFYSGVVPTTAPKYFFQYKNIANEEYRCEIYQKDFGGESTEISGKAIIEKGESKGHLDPIRGTGLSLEILATEDLNFEDFYDQAERSFTVKLYRANILLFQGFLLPEGIFQSFTKTAWIISVKCVDGLGLLTDLSFVKDTGLQFSGRMTCLDIIANCLNRTGLKLKIRTFVDVFYYGMVSGPYVDVLANAKLNTDRFKKSDNNTIMSCQEVLLSVLKIFNACVTQEDGEWHIYRPLSFYSNQYPIFKRYEINNSFTGLLTLNLNRLLGSQVNNFYPHHCNANQQIEIKGAVTAYRLSYKYGFIGSILGNGTLIHAAGTKIYEDWEVRTWTESILAGSLVIDPLSTVGISFKAATSINDSVRIFNRALVSDINVTLEEGYSFDFKTRFISYGFPVTVRFMVRVGSHYLNWIDGSWVDGPDALFFNLINVDKDAFPNGSGDPVDQKFDRSFTINSQPLPAGAGGDVQITMYVPQKAIGGSFTPLVEVKSIELINTFQGNNVVGEFHTVNRINPVSTIVKDNGEVANGDNSTDTYLGAVFKSDGVTLTDNWARDSFSGSEVKPLLRIMAEDQLRANQIPLKSFSGDIFGYYSYLGVYSIDTIQGKFMPTSYSFNTYTNTGSARFLQLFTPEVFDMEYTKTDDYGETVKPTIVG